MHALTMLVPADAVDPLSDRLADEWEALSVSVEDAEPVGGTHPLVDS